MNPHKTLLRLLTVGQVFTLFAVLLMPTLIRLLDQTAGKLLYGLLVVVSVVHTLMLRRALSSLD